MEFGKGKKGNLPYAKEKTNQMRVYSNMKRYPTLESHTDILPHHPNRSSPVAILLHLIFHRSSSLLKRLPSQQQASSLSYYTSLLRASRIVEREQVGGSTRQVGQQTSRSKTDQSLLELGGGECLVLGNRSERVFIVERYSRVGEDRLNKRRKERVSLGVD